jgi:hypothetical protein
MGFWTNFVLPNFLISGRVGLGIRKIHGLVLKLVSKQHLVHLHGNKNSFSSAQILCDLLHAIATSHATAFAALVMKLLT